jgi:hypothetical protein
MSIDSLVSQFGITLYLREPTYAVQNDGTVDRTYGRISSVKGFIQPSGQTEPVIQGRLEGRTAVSIYFVGAITIGIDWEIHDSEALTARQWRVTGVTNPGEVGQSGAAQHLNMTVVDAIEIQPEAVVAEL